MSDCQGARHQQRELTRKETAWVLSMKRALDFSLPRSIGHVRKFKSLPLLSPFYTQKLNLCHQFNQPFKNSLLMFFSTLVRIKNSSGMLSQSHIKGSNPHSGPTHTPTYIQSATGRWRNNNQFSLQTHLTSVTVPISQPEKVTDL